MEERVKLNTVIVFDIYGLEQAVLFTGWPHDLMQLIHLNKEKSSWKNQQVTKTYDNVVNKSSYYRKRGGGVQLGQS